MHVCMHVLYDMYHDCLAVYCDTNYIAANQTQTYVGTHRCIDTHAHT